MGPNLRPPKTKSSSASPQYFLRGAQIHQRKRTAKNVGLRGPHQGPFSGLKLPTQRLREPKSGLIGPFQAVVGSSQA